MLDIEQPDMLLAYLKQTGRIELNESLRITNLAGGVSNRTVWVERESGEAWVLKQALEKLRVKVDWFSSPERIHREALGLRWLVYLAPSGTTVPLVFEDFEAHVLAMNAVPQPHVNWKTMLLAGQLEQNHVEQFGRLLAAIHLNAYRQRSEVASVFADNSFFVSLRIEPYYVYAAEQVPEAAAFIRRLIDDTLACRETLVHGDYSPKNILVYDNKLILLDHEVIHWGDPAFDLGFSLTHLLSKAHHLPGKRADFAEAAVLYWHTYQAGIGSVEWAESLEARAVRHTLACLLARVAGRSPLEYLDDRERAHQKQVVLTLIAQLPVTMPDLITRFIAQLETT